MWLAKIYEVDIYGKPAKTPDIVDLDRYILKHSPFFKDHVYLAYNDPDSTLTKNLDKRYSQCQSMEELKIKLDIEGNHVRSFGDNSGLKMCINDMKDKCKIPDRYMFGYFSDWDKMTSKDTNPRFRVALKWFVVDPNKEVLLDSHWKVFGYKEECAKDRYTFCKDNHIKVLTVEECNKLLSVLNETKRSDVPHLQQ